MNGDHENEFCFEIANDSEGKHVFAKDGKYKITGVEIQSVMDDVLFPDRYKNQDRTEKVTYFNID